MQGANNVVDGRAVIVWVVVLMARQLLPSVGHIVPPGPVPVKMVAFEIVMGYGAVGLTRSLRVDTELVEVDELPSVVEDLVPSKNEFKELNDEGLGSHAICMPLARP